MAHLVTLHSFRRGTGKSTVTINLAASLAMQGYRVAVVDTDFQAPSMYILLGLQERDITHSLNDYLWGECDIATTVHDLTARLRLAADIPGYFSFISASPLRHQIERMNQGGYFLNLIGDGLHELYTDLELDIILLDTRAGLDEDTLFFIAIANHLILTLHPDKQDYQGTAIITDLARQLDVPHIQVLANEMPQNYEVSQVKEQLVSSYECDEATVLPFIEEMSGLSMGGIFVLRYAEHDLTKVFQEIASTVIAQKNDS